MKFDIPYYESVLGKVSILSHYENTPLIIIEMVRSRMREC